MIDFQHLFLATAVKQGWLPVLVEGEGLRATLLVSGRTALVLLPWASESQDVLLARSRAWLELLGQGPLRAVGELVLLYVGQPDPELAPPQSRGWRARVRCAWVDPSSGRHSLGRWGLGRLVRTVLERRARGEGVAADDLEELLERERERARTLGEKLRGVVPWGTRVLVGLCLVMFGWEAALGGSESLATLVRLGANFAPLTFEGQWWRLFGSAFLHIGLVHLAVNTYSLWIVGRGLEMYFGTIKFLALYSCSVVAGSLASAATSEVVSAGASGGIFGLCGATVVLGLRHRARLPAMVRRSLIGGMTPAIVYNLIFGFSVSGIDNAAHLGGLIAGLLFAAVVTPDAFSERRRGIPLLALVALAPLVGLGVSGWQAVARPGLAFYPQRVYRAEGFSFAHPIGFRWEGEFLAGPGMNIAPSVVESDAPLVEEQVVAEWESIGAVVREHRWEDLGGRRWLVLEFTEQDALGVFGFHQQDGSVYLVGVFTASGQEAGARAVLLEALRSFEITKR